MSNAEQSLAIFILVCAVPIAGFAGYAFQNREKPGVRGLLLCLVGMVGWSVQIALVVWPTQLIPVSVNTTIRYLFQILVIFGWPLLVWEYSNRTQLRLRRSYVAGLLIIPLLTLLFTLTNSRHYLVYTAETPSNPVGVSEFVYGPWYLVYMAFAITLVMLPVGTLLSDLRSAHGTHRRQLLLLLTGWIFGFVGALNSLLVRSFEWIPPYVDLTPVTFIMATGMWGTALFRYNLFNMLPVSRRTAIETMPDPVLSIDSNGIVVDANPAAHELFDAHEDGGQTTLTEFCAEYPVILSAYELRAEQSRELSLDTDTGTRHFSLYTRPIEQGRAVTGSLLVLREITQLRERERELELLKQVLSRVFRHNMRNRLNIIEGHMQVIANNDDDQFEDHTETISKTIDQLLSHSDKAVDMQGVIDTDTTDRTIPLGAVARHELTTLQAEYPAIETTVDCEDIAVQCHPNIEKAVQELLENAVSHADDSLEEVHLKLTVTQSDGMGGLVIEDNGPGIGTHEIEALNAAEETDLNHGSGVGLWLVRLLVQKSCGTLTIDRETELGGTRVELTFPAPTDTQKSHSSPQSPA